MKRININTKEKCFRVLYSMNTTNFDCKKCKKIDGDYFLNSNYEKICSSCKKIHSTTKNTIFENVRFGIVKAMNIVYDIQTSKEYLSSIAISKKYEITQKTAWLFIKKINSNKRYIDRLMNVEIQTKKSIFYNYKFEREIIKSFSF
ncbi:hypothetical protein ACSVH2_07235 [Flavobacterium sp. RSB2_4_14]|uniref:hypothetical protein n=1 Tax=Flavobacterium sp. RSB2_4_14 TaxID=3447665 RepID=UPI003F377E58